jgi:hypothetical protein
MRAPLSSYRLYCLNGSGSIDFAEDLDAGSDDEAIAEARRRKRNALKCEVWDGSRLVAKLDAADLAGQS